MDLIDRLRETAIIWAPALLIGIAWLRKRLKNAKLQEVLDQVESELEKVETEKPEETQRRRQVRQRKPGNGDV